MLMVRVSAAAQTRDLGKMLHRGGGDDGGRGREIALMVGPGSSSTDHRIGSGWMENRGRSVCLRSA